MPESQRADQRNTGGVRCLFVLDQEQLGLANLLGAELVGWLVEVSGKLGDRVQVEANRGGRKGSDLQVLQQPLSNGATAKLLSLVTTSQIADRRKILEPTSSDRAAGRLVQWVTTARRACVVLEWLRLIST